MSRERPGPPLRIAVLGDFEGLHTRRWVEHFVARGHEIHAISYYPVSRPIPGVVLHVLSPSPGRLAGNEPETSASVTLVEPPRRLSGVAGLRQFVSPSLLRLAHAWRYRRAGLKRTLEQIRPDVFHAHYVVEHGFYGSFAGFHPCVVSAWGSDLLVESHRPLGALIARWALRRADFVTGNDASLVQRAVELGVPPDRAAVVHLGTERLFLEAGAASGNLQPEAAGRPSIISTRAHEPLYNIDTVIAAFARLRAVLPEARLLIAGRGSRTPALVQQAAKLGLGDSVDFRGQLAAEDLARELAAAQVYVSVPSSDSFAVSNLEAMAAGAFPVLSDLPSTSGWVEYGVNALLVPARDERALADSLQRALAGPGLRHTAALANREKVEADGLREKTMLQMESIYYSLAGRG